MPSVLIGDLSDEINKELKLYSNDVIDGIKREAKKSMSRLVKETKATAPVGKRKKHYRDNITSSKTSESPLNVEYTWYVKGSDYRLSHLLEHGHQTRSGGRVAGTGFIGKASESVIEDYEKAVEEVIKNGG